MVSLQGQLVEDPEQVVTTSLIVEIVKRAGYPAAELAGMGTLLVPHAVKMAVSGWHCSLATLLNVLF